MSTHESVNVHGSEYSVRASLGVAVLQSGDRAADVVKAADRAMYVQKSAAGPMPAIDAGRACRMTRTQRTLDVRKEYL
ncbi:diguanylate cyclase [Paraburkholderia sp. BR10937]|uniref:diguanylate cyclase domain-containing protein n=1 Tax=Paraburkholderia sp. BR10937 TaxID=3236994 RepID=UPI0034D1C666